MIRKSIIVFLLIFTMISSTAYGQIERNKNSIFRVDRTELGLGLGTTFYLGDFNEFMPFVEPRYYGSILHRFYFNLMYALRTTISFGNISGNSGNYVGEMPFYDMKYPYTRPTVYFSRNFIDFNTGVEIGFRPYESVMHRMNQRFTPYLFIGVGIMVSYPDSYSKTEDAHAASAMYPRIYGSNDDNSSTLQVFNIPIGLGFKYSPGPRWTIGGEWQFKKTFTDNIDRFNNIEPSDLNNRKKGSILMNTDWVSLVGITLSYRLAVQSKCPALKKRNPSTRLYQGINRDYNMIDNKSSKKKSKK